MQTRSIKSLFYLLLLVCCANTSHAQLVKKVLDDIKPADKFTGTPALQKRSQVIYFGVGAPNKVAQLIEFADYFSIFFGGTTTDYGKVGPIIAGYEYFIKDNVSLGINIGYAKAGKKYTNGSTQYQAELTAYTIALASSYHLYTTDKIDPYIKGAIGLNLWTSKESGVKIPIPTPFSYNGLVGIRYFLSPDWAPFGELGYSSLKFTASIGVAYKLK